jgi:hypothetical protein
VWIPGLPEPGEGDGAGLAALQHLEELRGGDPDLSDRLAAADEARKKELQGMSLSELADVLGGGEPPDDEEQE